MIRNVQHFPTFSQFSIFSGSLSSTFSIYLFVPMTFHCCVDVPLRSVPWKRPFGSNWCVFFFSNRLTAPYYPKLKLICCSQFFCHRTFPSTYWRMKDVIIWKICYNMPWLQFQIGIFIERMECMIAWTEKKQYLHHMMEFCIICIKFYLQRLRSHKLVLLLTLNGHIWYSTRKHKDKKMLWNSLSI